MITHTLTHTHTVRIKCVYAVLEGLEINQKYFVLSIKICAGFWMC